MFLSDHLDDPIFADISDHLRAAGWRVTATADLEAAAAHLRSTEFSVGVTAVSPANLEDVEKLVATDHVVQWVALAEKDTLEDFPSREIICNAFYDFHTIPLDCERFLITLGHAHGMSTLRSAYRQRPQQASGIIGTCSALEHARNNVLRVAQQDFSVLIHGESGTGKELIARAIHEKSNRGQGPFVAVNCAALVESLIQSELFGHEKGAFTGASELRKGRFEVASGGTIFLDEIADLSLDLQAILLRVLENRVIQRVGSTVDIPIDVRVITATNVDLEAAVNEGRFRGDLYYRLNVFCIDLPPLRNRGSDIEVLANHFLEKYSGSKGSKKISQRALRALQQHEWPGNIRELINRIQRAIVVCDGKLILPEHLGLVEEDKVENLETARMRVERETILQTMDRCGNNVSRAARLLGVSRVTLYRLLAKHRCETNKFA